MEQVFANSLQPNQLNNLNTYYHVQQKKQLSEIPILL